ncbi:hypothetical protein BDV96DRAFT_224153 [Lophiotrema nucula]|uniref:Uncharacterized protein n=1 Tax=Lophiotrema nucula TaxID=690887 RepID=A0A6A5YSR0_9PLEO|nr:hypothetical protein BDV96DRAFT_224153 [Lophiotrema nucula]
MAKLTSRLSTLASLTAFVPWYPRCHIDSTARGCAQHTYPRSLDHCVFSFSRYYVVKYMMLARNRLAALFLSIFTVADALHFATFADADCTTVWKDASSPNNYSYGACSTLEDLGIAGSFKLVNASNCSVTLHAYNALEGGCSSTVSQVAKTGTCYGRSWASYSIANCTQSFPSTSSFEASGKIPNHTGIIAGGAVAGVFALVLLLALDAFFRRRRRGRRPDDIQRTAGGRRHDSSGTKRQTSLFTQFDANFSTGSLRTLKFVRLKKASQVSVVHIQHQASSSRLSVTRPQSALAPGREQWGNDVMKAAFGGV